MPPVTNISQLKPGDHIKWACGHGIYNHHCIVVAICPEEEKVLVVHYIKGENPSFTVSEEWLRMSDSGFQMSSLFSLTGETVIKKDTLRIVEYNTDVYDPSEVIRRARSRLGESKYNLIWNNCEDFTIWCKTGKGRSIQSCVLVSMIVGVLAGFIMLPGTESTVDTCTGIIYSAVKSCVWVIN